MMQLGFETALGEITLVLFTTLAPAGAFALSCMSALLALGNLDEKQRRSTNLFLCIPLVMTMVGLVASATHLGNPANALFVFMGVGRSPLSTEVFCAVIFLLIVGVYWLYSFSEHPRIKLQKAWSVCAVLAGFAFITSIAFAYHTETIVSWNTVYVPLNLWLNALVAGPLVALLSLQVAGVGAFAEYRLAKALCALSAVALLVNTGALVLQALKLPLIANSFGTAAEIVPFYGFIIAVFFFCCAMAVSIYARLLRKGSLPRLSWSIVAIAVVLVGIFAIRFSFYMMHMTVGLGL